MQEIYAELSPSPIAAASLGQVYKVRLKPSLIGRGRSQDEEGEEGRFAPVAVAENSPAAPQLVFSQGKLKTGEAVAVKVQRPYVLETVTVDLFILRAIGVKANEIMNGQVRLRCQMLGPSGCGSPHPGQCHRSAAAAAANYILRPSFLHPPPLPPLPPVQQRTDIVALLDEWAERFFEELDYVKEGENATIFAAQMKDDLPQVKVPITYADYTSRRVLTTEWLEGEKLSQSTADDVGTLVNVGVICYLKQVRGAMGRSPIGLLGFLCCA